MSMKALQKALKGKSVDKFDAGTVIRWTAAKKYRYAVIKADNGSWYSTSASFNTHVPQILDFEALIEVLSKSEVEEIEVSDTWLGLPQ